MRDTRGMAIRYFNQLKKFAYMVADKKNIEESELFYIDDEFYIHVGNKTWTLESIECGIYYYNVTLKECIIGLGKEMVKLTK